MKNRKLDANRVNNPADIISALLVYIGEDLSREGIVKTPSRAIRAYKEFLSGYSINPKKLFRTFDSNGFQDLVTVANIDFYSMCEHHLLPFFGKTHIGYVPNGKILGLSKFARIVDAFARRLQTQENLTKQIADAIDTHLHPQGFIVTIEAEHLCVGMRGIKKKNFLTRTTIKRGVLDSNSSLLDQFYREIQLSNQQGSHGHKQTN